MAKLHLHQTFSHEFRPLQLFSVGPPSLRRRRALFQRIFRREKRTFFRWKNVKYDQRKCKWWKIRIFLQEFWPKIRWILSLFRCGKTTFSSRRPLGSHAWSCQFFCLEPFLQHQPTTNNSCCEESLLYTGVRAPQFSWWTLPFRGSWVVLFVLIIISLKFMNLIQANEKV